MVKASELRIGNWVNKFGHPKQVCADDLVFLEGEYEFDFSVIFKGVTLTPEILQQCGFSHTKRTVNFGDSGYDPETYYFILDGFDEFRGGTFKQPKYNHGFIIGSYKRREGFYYANQGRKTKGTNILYLHQLQNLYFALTGEELVYQPIKELT